jgi:dihydroorotate dehydrogenase electron transfer subunit
MITRVAARVVENRPVATFRALSLEVGPDFPISRPGQFVMLRRPGLLDPLLARPFSIYGRSGTRLQVLIKVAGRGTRAMALLEPGDTLDVLGPLGNWFPEPGADARLLLVGGGVGLAPLRYCLQEWPGARGRATLVFGARTADHLFGLPEPPADTVACTDDGSAGVHGSVLDGLAAVLGRAPRERWVVMMCGPEAMVRAVVARHGAAIPDLHASLEAHMACGMGACLGCVVADGEGGYLRLCKEGPVVSGPRLRRMYGGGAA